MTTPVLPEPKCISPGDPAYPERLRSIFGGLLPPDLWFMPIRLIKHEAVPQCGSYEVDIRTADLPSTSIGMMFRAVA